MSPFLIQFTVPVFLQAIATVVGLGSLCWGVYSVSRAWNKSEREKKEAAILKRQQQIDEIQALAKKNQEKIESIERKQNDSDHKQDKLLSLENSMVMFQRLHTEGMLRQDQMLAQFMEYLKEERSTGIKVEQILATQVAQEKYLNKYLEGLEKTIDEMSKKVHTLVPNKA